MTWKIIQGDVRTVLPTLPEASVNCCVTSPPYWGLRDYGTATWEGGDEGCDHLGPPVQTRAGFNERYFGRESSEDNKQDALRTPYKAVCAKCGARRIDAQLGLEPTPEEYVSSMVAVFREVRRVLRDDGTLWCNLGDSYFGSWGAQSRDADDPLAVREGGNGRRVTNGAHPFLKPKDLVGIPWRVAFALQADGWYLRSDIVWSKPNPMPESVTDRPTKAHEYVFLLSKSQRYYYNAEAIKDDAVSVGYEGALLESNKAGWSGSPRVHGEKGHPLPGSWQNGRRNRRSVWTVATEPFPGAHFAVMPSALARTCILAGCPEGGTVLDPFSGSGTTGVVATREGCSFVGVELNPQYAEMARKRLSAETPAALFSPSTPPRS